MSNKFSTGTTEDGRVYIQDDDFYNDARLYVDGDFYDKGDKMAYANKIAKALNQTEEEAIFIEDDDLTKVIIKSIQELHERVIALENK